MFMLYSNFPSGVDVKNIYHTQYVGYDDAKKYILISKLKKDIPSLLDNLNVRLKTTDNIVH